MKTVTAESSILLVIDAQGRLLPAIHESDKMINNIKPLLKAASLLDVPVLFTEHNPASLGGTADVLEAEQYDVSTKMHFDACREVDFFPKLHGRQNIFIAGCEAHVCVLQTALGLLHQGRRIYVVRDAIGSRSVEDKETGIRRMEKHGAEVVTTEMVLFEWLETAENPHFKEILSLIK